MTCIVDVRNYGIDEGPWTAPAPELAVWLRGVMERMVGMLDAQQWGGLCATAGSQSLRTWRKSYLTHPPAVHRREDVLELEESAIVGGRVECGRVGRVPGPVYLCDIRSSYAAVSCLSEVPVRVGATGTGSLPPVQAGGEAGSDCLAEVALETDRPLYPVRTKKGVIYPVGRLRVTLAGPELAEALRLGHVRHVYRWVQYELAPALRAYALAVYRQRVLAQRRGDAALTQWLKRMLVSLPGKMGQRDIRWLREPGVSPYGPWAAWWESHHTDGLRRMRCLAWSLERQERRGWAHDAVPAISAWILSAARVALARGLGAVGRDRAYYWDTDCILTDTVGRDRLLALQSGLPDGLGEWSVREEAQEAEVIGQRHYVMGGRRRCAGLPKGSEAAGSGADHYWYRNTFGAALVAHRAPQAGRVARQYTRVDTYRAGLVGPGGRVTPYYREDW